MKHSKEIIKHDIDGLLEITVEPFVDFRGEIWSIYQDVSFLPKFVEDKVSISKKNVLRGLHGDFNTWKLITSLHGSFFLAVVDIRPESKTYNQAKTFKISDKNPKLMLVPAGCLNGHLCTSDKCVFFYKWSDKYSGPENQITARWDEPKYNIDWPIDDPILSDRDRDASYL